MVSPEFPTRQVTPLFVGSFCTLAMNCSDCPTCTEAFAGVTATWMSDGALDGFGALQPERTTRVKCMKRSSLKLPNVESTERQTPRICVLITPSTRANLAAALVRFMKSPFLVSLNPRMRRSVGSQELPTA